MRWYWWTLLVVVTLTVVRLSFFTVDAGEYAYVTILGRPVETHDGSDGGAGLHFGWPWPIREVQRIDRRLQSFDLREMELLTPDADGKSVDKNLAVQACVFWKIADKASVDLFVRRLSNAEQARNILGERITSQLGAAISRMQLDDLVSTTRSAKVFEAKGDVPATSLALLTFPEPSLPVSAIAAEALVARPPSERTRVDDKVEELRQLLLATLKTSIRQEYGIDLVDIRLRRYNYPGPTRAAIFDRIKSERRKKRKEYEADGDFLARKIATEAEEQAATLLARAGFEAQKIKAEADATAMKIRSEAHARDPEFYEFVKKLEQYQTMLGDGKSMLLLSTHRPMFDLLFSAPKKSKAPPMKETKEAPGGSK